MGLPEALFERLHKWARHQDENFVTEAFACVLRYLLEHQHVVGVRLLEKITGGILKTSEEKAHLVRVTTQVVTSEGKPDLELRAQGCLVYVEFKVGSTPDPGQLRKYQQSLQKSGIPSTALIMVTRDPLLDQECLELLDGRVRWHELASCLEDQLTVIDNAHKVAGFLIEEFLHFLRIKGMALTHVDKSMPDGVRALRDLVNMLFEAAAGRDKTVKKRGTADYIGIKLEGNKYWVGVLFNDPEKIWFCTECRIDPDGARRLDGEVEEKGGTPLRWWFGVELGSEDVHFFSRSKVSQMEWLIRFLDDCLAKARSITLDQAPISERLEES